jgi:hypothetical protein
MHLDDVVEKLFGYTAYSETEKDVNHIDFIKKAIKNAPNTVSRYYEYSSDRAIKDFLFEQTDIAKQLKKIMEKANGYPEEENT